MAVPSSSIQLHIAMKPMAMLLILALTASLVHYAAAATGGAMGGGFSRGGHSGGSSSRRFSGNSHHHHYMSHSGSRTYVIRDTCSRSGENCKPKDVNESVENDSMDSLFYFLLPFSLVFAVIILVSLHFKYQTLPRRSVVKLQVALKGAASSLQDDLNHIARQADTSTNEGYKYVLEESAKALLRHSEFWLSSFLSEKMGSADEAERLFSQLSFEERSKFDKETLINVDSHQEEKKNDWEMVSISANPFIVVNIIVATTGQLNLPPICSASDLNAILMKLGGLTKREIMAVHVLWTPQEENDHLSSERLQKDYPLLMELRTKLD